MSNHEFGGVIHIISGRRGMVSYGTKYRISFDTELKYFNVVYFLCNMSDDCQNESAVVLTQKNPRGKFIDSHKIQHIINVYKTKIVEQPNHKVKEIVKIISMETGLGQNTIQSTIYTFKNTGLVPVKLPNKKKLRCTIKEKVDFEKETIRQIVQSFWLNHEVPTLNKILTAVKKDPDLNDISISRASLYSLLKSMNLALTKRCCNITDMTELDSDVEFNLDTMT